MINTPDAAGIPCENARMGENIFLLPFWLFGMLVSLIADAIGSIFEALLAVLPLFIAVVLLLIAGAAIIGVITFTIIAREISRFLARRAASRPSGS